MRLNFFSSTVLSLFALAAATAVRSDPAGPKTAPQQPPLVTHLDIQYTQSGPAELMDIFTQQGATTPRPALVAVHGGGWSAGNKREFDIGAPYFVNLGFVFVSIDYRLDQVAPYPAQIEDCKCAVRFLKANAAKYHIDPNRIGVWGASAGGHLVALLGTTAGIKRLEGSGGWQDQSSSVAAVLDWFGPTDLRASSDPTYNVSEGRKMIEQLLGGSPVDKPELASDASPVAFVKPGDPPFLIMHGSADPLVPVSQSQELYDALKAAGDQATLKIVQGAAHGGPQFFSPDNVLLMDSFLRTTLSPAPQTASARAGGSDSLTPAASAGAPAHERRQPISSPASTPPAGHRPADRTPQAAS